MYGSVGDLYMYLYYSIAASTPYSHSFVRARIAASSRTEDKIRSPPSQPDKRLSYRT